MRTEAKISMKDSTRIVRLCAVLVLSCGSNLVSASDSNEPLSPSAQRTTEEILRCRFFEEPLVPIGGEASAAENAALAAALGGYAKRASIDDFSFFIDFLLAHPRSPWRAALLANLGLEHYNTAHYSLALAAWEQAWLLARDANDATGAKGKALADRVAGELAQMYARLGRMTELEALLKSFEGRVFVGSATEKIAGAREGLWNMQNRPDIAFRCGPLALHRIKQATDPQSSAAMTIFESASTQKGFSLPQVAELSRKIGLNYQMAFREKGGDFVVPSVLHWKVNHYAAIVRQEGDRYLLQDPTFRNDVWATRAALEAETSGYFAIPSGALPKGWRNVETQEGNTIWGKGMPSSKDDKDGGPDDPKTGSGGCKGMAVSGVHLMLVSLNLTDEPVGYLPPVGPPVKFIVRYNQRDAYQPATFTYPNFGSKWTSDWISYITDNPQSPAADVNYYIRGGGTRTFTGFNTNTQTYAFEQNDQTRLTRLGPANYEMVSGDGSKLVFTRSNGAIGTSRKVFLTQIVDPFGNAVTLNYDASLRLTTITDAIGQVTTLSYSNAADIYKITRVTDPFGRFASFDYDPLGRLTNITDVIGLTSQFWYEASSDFVNALVTPYGTNTFLRGEAGTTRWLETQYPDGSRARVEFNQNTNGIAFSNPAARVPQGMATYNLWLHGRNTFYWSRTACATAYGDYSKAKIYHWLHETDLTVCSGILESTKEALEERVWYDYAGQSSAAFVGSTDQPRHVGRVLDDGTTQLYTESYNEFGNLTNSVDPLGRTFSYVYSSNGIDLLEVRMTRAGKNELLSRTTYNAQHLPLTQVDAAGQTNTFTYNARGQMLTATDAKNETTRYTYDPNGYLIAVDGPLPGTNDVSTTTYDALGRIRTKTDVSGYTVAFDYDALDRLTRITYPDGSFSQTTYHRLQPSMIRDRAGRQTMLEHDAMGQLIKRTDPMNRITRYQWCSCGDLSTLTDPMGRTTTWHKDVQGRLSAKEYGDGSKVLYSYESATSRLREVIDEQGQRSQFSYNRDNTLRSKSHANVKVATPAVSYTYDPDYGRISAMTDGVGTTVYEYLSITTPPLPGAGELASVDGPLANDTITYGYDELGRRITTAINGVAATLTYDAAGRVVGETNVLGVFTRAHEGNSRRVVLEAFPNGLTVESGYGGNLEDHELQRLTHKVGATPLSEFLYGHDHHAGRITTWSQQAGAQPHDQFTFGYDLVDRLVSASVTNGGVFVNSFAYAYDLLDNRLFEQVGLSNQITTYNPLNQINTTAALGTSRTNEWDGRNRLSAVNVGPLRTEFTYDGDNRLANIRQLSGGIEVSYRRLLWSDGEIREERDAADNVTKRFFWQGVKIEAGTNAGSYYYTRDHLGSIRELTDASGNLRARYAYEPYGRRTRLTGDLEPDFGFARMFWSGEAGLALTWFRAYDPALGRWLSRDSLRDVEIDDGPNLYAYVRGNPINAVDRLGLSSEEPPQYHTREDPCCGHLNPINDVDALADICHKGRVHAEAKCSLAQQYDPAHAQEICARLRRAAENDCGQVSREAFEKRQDAYERCRMTPCQRACKSGGGDAGDDWVPPPPPMHRGQCFGTGRMKMCFYP
jgi:RHS repeat-associated protein